MTKIHIPTILFCAIILGIFMVVVAWTRPLMPIDETRYLTVAWEYYARGEWILPTLNYQPYHHKPPMLFWLINLIWAIFGTTDLWTTRIVPLMAGVACAALTFFVTRSLWPNQHIKADTAPILLISLPFFMLYSSVIMFDTLMTVAVLLGVWAMIQTALSGKKRYTILLGLALAFGGLIKGPVILLYLLPLYLLWPLWRPATSPVTYLGWYGRLIPALIIGVGVTLAWAIPAAKIGGPEYEHMIFWGQSAGRMVQAFDHARPFWFYIPFLFVILLPWILIPSFWRHIRWPAKGALKNRSWQTKMLLCWFIPVLLAFTAISGKQVHYLIPLLPAAVILLAHILFEHNWLQRLSPYRLYFWAMVPIFLIALILFAIETYGPQYMTHGRTVRLGIQLADTHSFILGIGLILIVLLPLGARLIPIFNPVTGVRLVATAVMIIMSAVHLSAAPMLTKYYSLEQTGQVIGNAATLGAPVAVTPNWQGEFGYMVRLHHPVTILKYDQVRAWVRKNPAGIVIYRHDIGKDLMKFRLIHTRVYRSPNKAISIIGRR